MYTLRVLHPSGDEQNYYLGDFYEVILEHRSPESFKKKCSNYLEKNLFFDEKVSGTVYGFVISEVSGMQPLYYSNKNYIVMESGKTFQKL